MLRATILLEKKMISSRTGRGRNDRAREGSESEVERGVSEAIAIGRRGKGISLL